MCDCVVMIKLIMLVYMFISVMNDHSWSGAVSIVKLMLLASDQVAVLEPNSSVVKEELELRDRGELLRRLALSSPHLDIILSVAVYVIIYKLLKSGDVEKNPGPGNLDYNSVDASTTLGRFDHVRHNMYL